MPAPDEGRTTIGVDGEPGYAWRDSHKGLNGWVLYCPEALDLKESYWDMLHEVASAAGWEPPGAVKSLLTSATFAFVWFCTDCGKVECDRCKRLSRDWNL